MSAIDRAIDKLSRKLPGPRVRNNDQENLRQDRSLQSSSIELGLAQSQLNTDLPNWDRELSATFNGDPDHTATQYLDLEILPLPVERFKSLGLISPDLPRSQIAEEYRRIKRPILSNLKNTSKHNQNIVMITSSIEGEGKTFSSINLALSIAMERDKTVLLVDADTAKASAGKLFEIPPECPGLIDVLLGKTRTLRDVILQTDVPSLRFMPVGENHDHVTELLASESMYDVVAELSRRYSDRVIIFDGPPLLSTTEAKVLSGLVGQVVFVVEAEQTGQSTVTEALSCLDKEQSIGLILNKSRKSKMRGYGYGYGYGATKQAHTQNDQRR